MPAITRRSLVVSAALALPWARGLAAEPGYEWRPWPPGRRPPALALQTLDGTPWRLAEMRGRVLLANFWATWCEPCRAEMPSLARLASARAADGLSVMAINYREGPPAIERFMQSLSIQLPVLLDRDGSAASAWTPRIFPSTVVFDREGRPHGVLVGEIDWESAAARALVDPLVTAAGPRKTGL
jgi:thiol-disulfide isomerase/thioredoxin